MRQIFSSLLQTTGKRMMKLNVYILHHSALCDLLLIREWSEWCCRDMNRWRCEKRLPKISSTCSTDNKNSWKRVHRNQPYTSVQSHKYLPVSHLRHHCMAENTVRERESISGFVKSKKCQLKPFQLSKGRIVIKCEWVCKLTRVRWSPIDHLETSSRC